MNRQTLAPRTGTPSLVRAAAIALAAYAHKQHLKSELQSWRDTKDVDLIIRAATAPASLTTTAWADTLAMTTVADFISVLGPSSAGSTLLARGLQFQFNGAAAIAVPTIAAAATGAGFVKEADPIPVRQFAFSGPRLEPRKFATEATFTREVFEHSTPSIESIVRATLVESVGLALDQALFSNTAGDATRPPGLLLGIPALTPSANTDHAQALTEDVATLAAAVSAIAGNGEIAFIASPKQAVALQLRFGFPYLVLASAALADKTVIAVASNGIASATDPTPRFDISNETTNVERDDPGAVSVVGTPPTVAAPTRSLWQTDTISLRMIFEMSWVLRHASGLAHMANVLW